MTFNHIAPILKEMRKETGKTQAEFSKKYNVHSQFCSNWERSLCLPPSPEFKRMIRDFPNYKPRILEALLKDAEENYKNKFKL